MKRLMLLFFFVVRVASAQDTLNVDTGNNLFSSLRACEISTKTPYDAAYCHLGRGFIEGVVHTLDALGYMRMPEHVTNAQLYDIVRKYLDNHPENRQNTSAVLVVKAFNAVGWVSIPGFKG